MLDSLDGLIAKQAVNLAAVCGLIREFAVLNRFN